MDANIKKLNQEDLKRLINFYLACIGEEDLRSLTFRLSQLHRTFLSPWEDREPIFFPNKSEVHFIIKYKSDKTILLRGTLQAGEPLRLFYGYPIYIDNKDMIAPLFFTEAEIQQNTDNEFILRLVDPENIQFNHHFLSLQHTGIEEIQKIQEYLEGSFGSFDARLNAAFDYIGYSTTKWQVDSLDPFPVKETERDTWVNRPILFRSERSAYTYHLRRELEALVKYPRFLEVALDTSLGHLFNHTPKKYAENDDVERPETKQLFEIRPLNLKQEKALHSGLSSPLTVVTGPPGTGKSQIVVNLLANAVIAGKTVLFASKNNKAVDVIREWFQEILSEDEDWTFRVGSGEKMEKLKEEMTARIGKFTKQDSDKSTSLDYSGLQNLDKEILSIRSNIEGLMNQLMKLRDEINQKRIAESLVPEAWVKALLNDEGINIDKSLVDRLRRETETLACGKGLGLKLWILKLFMGVKLLDKYYTKLKNLVSDFPDEIRSDILRIDELGINWKLLTDEIRKLAHLIKWLHYRRRANEVLDHITKEEDAASLQLDIDKLKDKKTNICRDILRSYWTGKIASELGQVRYLVRHYFDVSEKLRHVSGRDAWLTLKDDFDDTCNQLFRFIPVWIVTSLSARRALPLKENLFDLAVIDEASQCDIVSAIPILFRAKRAVIIGDPHQLSHISTLNTKQETQIAELNDAVSLLTNWSYISNSLYDISEAAIVHSGRNPIFLAEHYRSHPAIIEFSNRTFYERSLVLRTKITYIANRLGNLDLGMFWHNVIGKVPDTLRSAFNEDEIREIIRLLSNWATSGLLNRQDLTLGIVTPFRLQMERIEENIRKQSWFELVKGRMSVGTAHRFQGAEADVIIFSPVVSKGIHPRKARWVADTDQLLNVSITRARGALHIVGDAEKCKNIGGFLGEFASYVLSSQTHERTPIYESPAEEKLADFLEQSKLWYHPQYEEKPYRLDFFVVSPFGNRYDLEVDGRQHWSAEQFNKDEIRDKKLEEKGYKIIRINADEILMQPGKVELLINRLV